jgi:serine/threonine-protein kinase
MALAVGDRVGDYEVLALLGAGGMGCVYKVRNIISNRDEAMKVLLPDLNSERELAVRFMVEIRTLAGLEHPNIAQLRTAFQFENQLVMIMEFVEGATLEQLTAESPLPVERVLDYSLQALSALSLAHRHGVTHRDIKPANIMVTPYGQVKLMDFGIAKGGEEMQLTRPGMTIGSVYYMSPEQVRGGTVDARSDIYSFGIMLYEALTGRKPFEADTSYTVLNAQLNEAPLPPIEINPALPRELNDIVLRALEKNPDARFQTAQEFHDVLRAQVEPRMPRTAATPAVQPQGFVPVPAPAAAFSATAVAATPSFAADAATPPFVPVAPLAAVAPPAAKSHRGLWIGLGALAAVLALVAAATVLPHLFSTHASQKSASTALDAKSAGATDQASGQQQSTPTPSSSSTMQPNSAAASTPEEGQGRPANFAQQVKTGPAMRGSSNGNQQQAASSGTQPQTDDHASAVAAAAAGPSKPAGPSPQEVRQARDRLMNLDSRADAARSGVQGIRSQQQAQGLDMRGDILSAMSRMNSLLGEAHRALDANDLESANDYMNRADKEASTLESFLGR